MSNLEALSEQQIQLWSREQYQAATKYLATKGIVTSSVMVEDCRYIAPLVAIWKLKLLDNRWIWAISGDLPCDHVAIEAGKTAKEVMLHFSMNWQLNAENIFSGNPNEEQKSFANILIAKAEMLYDLVNDDLLWKER